MTLVEAVAAIESLPELTRAIEDAVHLHGLTVHAVAKALELSDVEVHGHLRAAREARGLLLVAGVVGENRATRVLAREEASRADVAELVNPDPSRAAWLAGQGPMPSYTAGSLFGMQSVWREGLDALVVLTE